MASPYQGCRTLYNPTSGTAGSVSEEVHPQVLEHGDTVKKLNATEVAKEAAEGAVRASANAARKAEAALVCACGPCPLESFLGCRASC